MKIKDFITIIMRLYVALIVGMCIVNAAFSDDDEEEQEKNGTSND
jgi:flagellar basal body-associated protein FliL